MFEDIEVELVLEKRVPLERKRAEVANSPKLRVAKESAGALLLELQKDRSCCPQRVHKAIRWL